MPPDVSTVLTSAGLSAVVAVFTAGTVARRKDRADRDLAARRAVREAVRPVRQEVARWDRQGSGDRKPGLAVPADPEAVSAVLGALPDLPAWRGWLVRRRLRRLFGALWVEHLEVFPYNPETTMLSAMLRQERDEGPTGRTRLLTDGQVHRTLAGTPWGLSARDLDRQLRRLAACW
ncbi:hypothetical protein [Geodermatophilus sp. CPCC 205761]|uniref:hypothetical protein n=1 Tax=Geodermatophilus sp. CPCC 205761 TaxID=2936597 RepID=UPI003EE83FB8